jgi:hypothetical protein
MPKPERIYRDRKLTAEEADRDAEIRRKVMEEFPPLATVKPPRLDSLSEELREAIRADHRTVPQIADAAGISDALLARFLSGERDIRMATADKLADALGLKLSAGSQR